MTTPNPEQMSERDKQLWKIAKKRVSFRRHLASYVIVNAFLWALWFFSDGMHHPGRFMIPWPVWPMMGWGLGLAFNYYDAFHGSNIDAIDKEFERLKNRSNPS